MTKRNDNRNYLLDYNDYIAHRYTRSRNGWIPNYFLHVWSNRKPYSKGDGIMYIISGIIILLLSLMLLGLLGVQINILGLLVLLIISIIFMLGGIIIVITK
jgi:hypothetical protein